MVLLASHNFTTGMNNYQEKISASLENSRNSLRRIARHDDTECSNQSIFNVMETFVKTVNAMDETILVPCRLMDRQVGDESSLPVTKGSVQDTLRATDLFQVYSMLKGVKDSLLWSGQNMADAKPPNQTVIKGHVRRPSTVSVASTNSTGSNMSDSESEVGSNENDSGIEEPVTEECATDRLEHDFRRHLYGLNSSLRQMTEAAQYLTWRYQHDIGGPV